SGPGDNRSRAGDSGGEMGTVTVTWTAECGMAAGLAKVWFTLAFVAPPPAPVTRCPLQCDQVGICS
ncbi:MAG TPA: hypothetical protein PL146_13760, partial [Mycobacterium sp.]|nr:hypothetical protein [Mycobacterium sp.]